MMTSTKDDTDVLLSKAADGDTEAKDELFRRHRTRLKRAVQVRLDPRLRARVDPSDILQESLLEASEKLDDFIQQRPLPFYAWLRQVALDRLKKVHRFHLRTQQRSVVRESDVGEHDASGVNLAEFFATQSATPSQAVAKKEQRRLLETAVARLPEADREILVMRYLEEMPSTEAAATLGVSLNAYAQRHVRAVQRLRKLLVKDA